MKHLFKINEANINDKFAELKSKSQIEEVISEMDDLLLDIKDQFDIIPQTANSSISIKYRRRKNRKSSISYEWYKEVEKNGGECTASDLNYLNRFLEYAELAVEAQIKHIVPLRISMKFEDLKDLKKELESSYERSKSMGIDLEFGYTSLTSIHDAPVYGIDELISIITDIFDVDYFKGNYVNIIISYNFSCPIDPSKFKSEIDFESQVPSNIVSDFKNFVIKYRIPSDGKKEFVNIINKVSSRS